MKFAKYAALRPSSAGVQHAADYRPSPMAWTDILTRELDDELVPEWRAKYLDYKVRLSARPAGDEAALTLRLGW